jgi:Phosphoserine phosphatase
MNTPKRLVQFDVDSTFIQQEAIELLAAKAGVFEQVSAVTESAMRGELDFAESLIARVALLEGLSERVIKEVQEEILLTDGAADLVALLHRKRRLCLTSIWWYLLTSSTSHLEFKD